LAQGQPGETAQLLERLYEYQPAAARSRLVQALLAEAQTAEDDDEQLALYERVLELDSAQPEAIAGRRRIGQQWGDRALKAGDLMSAQMSYQMAGLTDKVVEVEQEIRRRDLASRLREIQALEQEGRYQDALDMARKLAKEYPEMRDWTADLERLERKTHLADLYQRGLGALQSDDRKTAQPLLSQVVALEPGYEEATRYLHLAVREEDVAELRGHLKGGLPSWVERVALGLLSLTCAFLIWFSFLGGRQVLPFFQPTPTVTHTPTLTETPMPAPSHTSVPTLHDTRSTDRMVMVYVPAEEFEMGSTEGGSDEQPVHTVTLDGFWIDQTEVTNAQFVAFLNEQGDQTEGGVTWPELDSDDCLIERVGGEYRPKNGYADHPVIEVSWYGADAYCEWAGARLPTEAEWEYAARGPQGFVYPWGNDAPTCERAQFSECSGHTVPVGSLLAGASWCGALDMAGNVWEWVADWYRDYPSAARTNPTGQETGSFKVLRGGSWSRHQMYVRAAYRYSATPYFRSPDVGFRCVVFPPGE